MTATQPRVICFAVTLALLVYPLCVGFAGGKAEPLKVEAQLVWGTNDDQAPPGANYQEVEPKLRKKLLAVFKWKNYFEVERKALTVPLNKTQRVKLSSKCEVEVTNFGNSNIEAKLFGEGKFMVRKR